MRTLTTLIALIVISMNTIFAQPLFINDEPNTEFIQNADGTWRKVEIVNEIYISQPKDLKLTKEQIQGLSSGYWLESVTLITRNGWLGARVKFNLTGDQWFESTTHHSVQPYELLNGSIQESGSPYILVKKQENDFLPWVGALILLWLFSLYVFPLDKPSTKVSAICFAILLVGGLLVAYIPIKGLVVILAAVIISTVFLRWVVIRNIWNKSDRFGLTVISFFTSLVFYCLTRLISEGRGEFLLAMFLYSLFLLGVGWLWYRLKRRRAEKLKRDSTPKGGGIWFM